MKAERRHQLQENTLAKKIVELPNFGRKWAGRAALALAVVVVIVALVYNRINAGESRRHEASDLLYVAAEMASSIRFTPPGPDQPITEMYVRTLQAQYDKGHAAIERVRELTQDAKLLAQADVIQGDLAYSLASLPVAPEAATRPTEFSPKPSRDGLIKIAEQAYQEVVTNYSDQPLNLAAAQFGLGAIAENRGEWDKAAGYYQSVKNSPDAAPIFKQVAEARSKMIADLKHNALVKATEIAPLVKPTTEPATAPTTAEAISHPTTKPSAAPTTKPSTTGAE